MYVCICNKVTDKEIVRCIELGATTLRDLKDELGVASQCGKCGHCARQLLRENAEPIHAVGRREVIPILSYA